MLGLDLGLGLGSGLFFTAALFGLLLHRKAE